MAETVTTGDGKRSKLPHWKFVLLIAGVVVLAGGAGVAARWWQQREGTHDHAGGDHVHPGEYVFSEDVVAAQKLAQDGDYDKAHEAINNALANPSISNREKHDLLVQQGVTYESQQNYDAALESYRQAETFMESLQVAQSIANIAQQKGDKELAITYFKKALALAPDDPAGQTLKRYFEDAIKYLETGETRETGPPS